jgi:hypothetical protein
MRYSRRSHAQLEKAAQIHNEAMVAVARELGVQHLDAGHYDHPMMGRYTGWTSVAGDVNGVWATVGGTFDYGGESSTYVSTQAGRDPCRERCSRSRSTSWSRPVKRWRSEPTSSGTDEFTAPAR